jgi:hypothetical protein
MTNTQSPTEHERHSQQRGATELQAVELVVDQIITITAIVGAVCGAIVGVVLGAMVGSTYPGVWGTLGTMTGSVLLALVGRYIISPVWMSLHRSKNGPRSNTQRKLELVNQVAD